VAGGVRHPDARLFLFALPVRLQYRTRRRQVCGVLGRRDSHRRTAAVPALVFGFIGNLFGGLAHYSSGPAGVIFGSGYVKTAELFRIGFAISVVNILIWTVVGGGWMKLIAIW
jgi:hypothetical protein